jgi:hypothetical protein
MINLYHGYMALSIEEKEVILGLKHKRGHPGGRGHPSPDAPSVPALLSL